MLLEYGGLKLIYKHTFLDMVDGIKSIINYGVTLFLYLAKK